MRVIASSALRFLMVFVLGGAMTTMTLAHRTNVQVPDGDMLAFLQAGGTLAELCGTFDENGEGTTQDCEACRLIDSVAKPSTANVGHLQYRLQTQQMQRRAQARHHAKPLDATRLSRAPPQT